MDDRLKGMRKKKGMTQVAVGMKIGVDQSDYSKIERGKKKISLQIAIQLALLYGTSIDYIVGFTDQKEPYPRAQKTLY